MNDRNRSVPGRNNLSDREMLFDLFVGEKYLSLLYDQAIMTSTNERVRDTIESLQQSGHQLSEKITAVLQQHSWHPNQTSGQQFSQQAKNPESLSTTHETVGSRCLASSRVKRSSDNNTTRRSSSQFRRNHVKSELSNLNME